MHQYFTFSLKWNKDLFMSVCRNQHVNPTLHKMQISCFCFCNLQILDFHLIWFLIFCKFGHCGINKLLRFWFYFIRFYSENTDKLNVLAWGRKTATHSQFTSVMPFSGLAQSTSQDFPAGRHVTLRLSVCQGEAAKSDWMTAGRHVLAVLSECSPLPEARVISAKLPAEWPRAGQVIPG